MVKDKTHPKQVGKELRLKFNVYKTEGKKKLLAIPVS